MSTVETLSLFTRLRARLSGDAGAALLLGLFTLALFSPYLVHPDWLIYPASGLGSDLVNFFWPNIDSFATALRDGRLLMWNNASALGYPTVGNLGLLWLYPPALVLLVLRPPYVFTVLAALHVFLGGLGFFFLVRSLFSVSRPAALVGAVAFMFMPKLVAHLAGGHITSLYGLAWLPAVLLGARKAMQSRRLWPAACAGLALAMQLPTHPQIPLSTLYLLGGMLAWSCWRALRRCGWRSRELRATIGRALRVSGTIGLVAAGIGAIWWIPAAELLPWSVPIRFEGGSVSLFDLPPAMLLTLLAPTDLQFPEWTIYSGVVVLFLSLIALLRRDRRPAGLLWAAVVLALLASLGHWTPFFSLAGRLIPGLQYFRAPTRLWFLGGVAIALLAALGADALEHKTTWQAIEQRRRVLRLTSVAYVFAAALAVIGMGVLTRRLPVEMLRSLILGTLFLALFSHARTHALPHRVRQGLVLGLVAVDLAAMAASYMTGLDLGDRLTHLDPITRFIAEQPGRFRVYSPQRGLAYPAAAELGIETMEGVSNFQVAGVADMANVASGCTESGYNSSVPACLLLSESEQTPTAALEPSLLGLLNVRYVVTDSDLQVPGLEPVLVSRGKAIYENLRFLPRAFIVAQVETVASQADIFQRLAAIDPARVGLVEPGANLPPRSQSSSGGTVVVESEDSGHIRLSAQTARESLLVYSEAWAPGWTARVNGVSATVVRVDGALLGVVIPPGASEVALDYLPIGWQIAWPITLASILLWGACGVVVFSRTRLRRRPAAPARARPDA